MNPGIRKREARAQTTIGLLTILASFLWGAFGPSLLGARGLAVSIFVILGGVFLILTLASVILDWIKSQP